MYQNGAGIYTVLTVIFMEVVMKIPMTTAQLRAGSVKLPTQDTLTEAFVSVEVELDRFNEYRQVNE